MISLNIQIKLIIFSFVFGFFFSCIIDILYPRKNKMKKSYDIFFSFMIVLLMSFIYFFGIQIISNAILHIYSVLSIIFGFSIYNLIIKLIANNNKKWYTLYGDNMAKRRVSKASKRRLTFFGTLSLIAIAYFLFSLSYNVYTIYNLKCEKRDLDKLYVKLQDEADSLKIDIEKLNDDTYLANYAREHYQYSKDGEYIIQIDIDDLDNIESDMSDEINKNYIIIGLSIFMLFVLVYIFSKNRKK